MIQVLHEFPHGVVAKVWIVNAPPRADESHVLFIPAPPPESPHFDGFWAALNRSAPTTPRKSTP